MLLHLKKYRLYYGLVFTIFITTTFLEKEVEYIIWALISVFVLMILLFYNRIRYYKEVKDLQQQKLEAELDLLKNQINPHFFFNTLNNLYGLTINNSEKAPEVILKLSEMMRYTIYKGKEDFVTLEEELNYITSFISLQKIRLLNDSKITFTKHIENPTYEITPLLFIILIENAFKHGAEKLGENAFVSIHLTENSNEVCLKVENSFLPSKGQQNEQGIGLNNLKRRLFLLHPNKHELTTVINNNIYISTLKIFQ